MIKSKTLLLGKLLIVEIRQLKYFLTIADSGSISKAAERLFIAQSALSTQICQLENHLRVTLLHRTSRGVSLTESGVAFYEHARAIMRQVEDAPAVAKKTLSESPAGTVILGIPQTASAALALPLFLAAREALPEVSLKFKEDLTGNLIEQLRQGRINLAILFDDGQLDEFATKQIVEERMYLLNASKAVSCGRITLETALASPLILPSIQHGVRQRIERTAQEHGFSLRNLVAEIDSLNILKSAVLSGVGATILPPASFGHELREGSVEAHELYGPRIFRTVTLCASRNIPLMRACSAVSKLLVRMATGLCESGKWQGATALPDDDSKWLT